MKTLMPLPYTVPLEQAAEIRDKLATPVEEIMASDIRSSVIQGLPYTRWQMIFLLLEYGFSDEEIADGMRMRLTSVRNVKYHIRSKLRDEG